MGIEHIDVGSALLGESVRVVVARPQTASSDRGPWVWLLHSWGSTVADVTWVVEGLDDATAAGDLGAHTIAAPVGPWSEVAWWGDSAYLDGRPVESAVLTEALPEIETRLGGPAVRDHRIVAGYSMGGGSVVAWLLRHPGLSVRPLWLPRLHSMTLRPRRCQPTGRAPSVSVSNGSTTTAGCP